MLFTPEAWQSLRMRSCISPCCAPRCHHWAAPGIQSIQVSSDVSTLRCKLLCRHHHTERSVVTHITITQLLSPL